MHVEMGGDKKNMTLAPAESKWLAYGCLQFF